MTDLATIHELSAAGRHQECLLVCQKGLQENPEEICAYKYAGISLLALGEFEKSKQFLVKAYELDDNDPEIIKSIGNAFLGLGDKNKAIHWYEKSLENNDYAPALNDIASLKKALGNNQEAINLFKRAIQADPKLIQSYVGIASCCLLIGDLDQAESIAKQALVINENTPGIQEILGSIFQNKGNSGKAIECYQKELELNPKAGSSLLNLGLLLLQKGQTSFALESLLRASDIAPSKKCTLLLAQSYQKLGKFQQAAIEYKKLNINQARNKMIPFNLGICLLETGENNSAVKAFQVAIQLDDTFIPAWGNIGTALIKEGRHLEALPVTKKVLELSPDDPGALLNLGGIHKELGKLDQALASTLKSLELNPNNHTAHMNLGGIYKDLGELDQALASTLKSLELKPDNPDALLNLGGIYKDLGELDRARAATLKSLDLDPDNSDSLINLYGIYKDLGEYKHALVCLREAMKSVHSRDKASIELAKHYHYMGLHNEGVKVINETHSKQAFNLLLSLYLGLDNKLEFNRIADYLIHKRLLDERGAAAIDHANILYNQSLDNGMGVSTMEAIYTDTINNQDFTDEFMQQTLNLLLSGSCQSRSQSHLANGLQTSGNLLDRPEKPFQVLKELLIQRIDRYTQLFALNNSKDFMARLQRNMYTLKGWAIIMDKGGSLKSHNHPSGWLTGTFYLQMPETGYDSDEGAIEFSHQGPEFPPGDTVFETRVIRPSVRDLNVFSSSLFHRTLPFRAERKRICIAFDCARNEKLWDDYN